MEDISKHEGKVTSKLCKQCYDLIEEYGQEDMSKIELVSRDECDFAKTLPKDY